MRSARDPLRVGRIAAAPGTVHYRPAYPRFCTADLIGSRATQSISTGSKVDGCAVFNRFSGHDLTLLSNDKQA
jgi:hypothetical protein